MYSWRNFRRWLIDCGSHFRRQKKIRVILTGGLGNQLFQFALGRSIAYRTNSQISFEISSFKKDDFYQRNFSLVAFQYPARVKTHIQPRVNYIFTKLRELRQKRGLFDDIFSPFGFIERSLGFDPDVVDDYPRLSQTLIGYWQDDRYFRDVRDILLRDLTPCKNLSPQNELIDRHIRELKSPVAVHVRYNHEVKSGNPQTLDVRRAANLSLVWVGSKYYDLAVDYISSITVSPNYIIFSDNPKWVKENLTIFKNCLILETGRGEDWEDIVLMSHCKYHIIANSSFSWWGAWLCDHQKKVVVAPKNYLYTPALPTEWVAIDVR